MPSPKDGAPKKHPHFQCIFFDAAGTLIHPAEQVGLTYGRVGADFGFRLDPQTLDRQFRQVFSELPPPDSQDEKAWWKRLVHEVFQRSGARPDTGEFDRCFEALFAHFASPDAWGIYPEVTGVLTALTEMEIDLHVLSNFDGRLHGILDGLGLRPFFSGVTLSSEVGAWKPSPEIFAAALAQVGRQPGECLHVGDDPVGDWEGAEKAGLAAYKLDRPQTTLAGLLG